MFKALLPHVCDACSALSASAGFCGSCLGHIRTITAPFCEVCGFPLPFAGLDRCDRCVEAPSDALRIRGAYVYGGPIRRCLLRLKQHDSPAIRKTMLQQFLRTVAQLPVPDAVVCVPSSRRRLLLRGHNPAAPWAQAAAQHLHRPFVVHALRRRPWIGMQKRLRRQARWLNARYAYLPGRDCVRGLNLLLVDDVVSTGATVRACTDVLYAAGARSVNVAVAALTASMFIKRYVAEAE